MWIMFHVVWNGPQEVMWFSIPLEVGMSLAEDQISHRFPWLSCGTLPQQRFPDLSGNLFGCCPACLPLWHPVRGRVNWVLSHSTGSGHASLGSSETVGGPERFILPGLFFPKVLSKDRQPLELFPWGQCARSQNKERIFLLPPWLCRIGCSSSLSQQLMKWSVSFIMYSLVRGGHHRWSCHGRLRSWLEG